jgi:RNA polymerase sigma factor for flagellar operon FliA
MTSDEAVRLVLPSIRRIASRMSVAGPKAPYAPEFEDLVQEGVIGALDALKRYDSSLGCKPKTFMLNRARFAMIDYCRMLDPLSRADRRDQRTIWNARENATHDERRLTDEEVAGETGLTLKRVRDLDTLALHATPISLETPVYERDGSVVTVGDIIAAREPEPYRTLTHEDHEIVARALYYGFNRRDREIAVRYFQDDALREIAVRYFQDDALREIARDYRVSDSRVSQIAARARQLIQEAQARTA